MRIWIRECLILISVLAKRLRLFLVWLSADDELILEFDESSATKESRIVSGAKRQAVSVMATKMLMSMIGLLWSR